MRSGSAEGRHEELESSSGSRRGVGGENGVGRYCDLTI